MVDDEEIFLKNRRKEERTTGIVVEYRVDGVDPTLKKAFVKDISKSGLCIYVQEAIEKDTILSLAIYMSDRKDAIFAKGKIIWQKRETGLDSCYTGIEFTEMEKKYKKILFKCIPKN